MASTGINKRVDQIRQKELLESTSKANRVPVKSDRPDVLEKLKALNGSASVVDPYAELPWGSDAEPVKGGFGTQRKSDESLFRSGLIRRYDYINKITLIVAVVAIIVVIGAAYSQHGQDVDNQRSRATASVQSSYLASGSGVLTTSELQEMQNDEAVARSSISSGMPKDVVLMTGSLVFLFAIIAIYSLHAMSEDEDKKPDHRGAEIAGASPA